MTNKTILFCILSCFLLTTFLTEGVRKTRVSDVASFKNVQGPPEEFDLHKLPKPQQNALSSKSAITQIFFEEKGDHFEWTGDIPVDSSDTFSISIVTKIPDVDVQIQKPSANSFGGAKEEKGLKHLEKGSFGWDQAFVPSTTYSFEKPEIGVWKVRLTTKQFQANQRKYYEKGAAKPDAWIISGGSSNYKVFSHLGGESYKQLRVNEQVSFVARVFDESKFNGVGTPEALQLNFVQADVDLISPDGEETVISMHDDGEHMDNAAGDGVLGATFTASHEGNYIAQIVVRGVNPEGQVFLRSSTHLVTVVENDHFDILPEASASIHPEDEMMKIMLSVKYDVEMKQHVVGQKFRPYVEVFGTNLEKNEQVPVAFLTGMSVAQETEDNVAVFALQMSMKWLSKAGASFPLTLKNVYIQDVDNNIPVAEAAEIVIAAQNVNIEASDLNAFIKSSKTESHKLAAVNSLLKGIHHKFKFNGEITETMLKGKRPTKYATPSNADGKIVLVHGYCSSGSPFDSQDFTNHEVFSDPTASRTHDEFALMVKDFAEEKGLDAFSFVAHSQGGLVSLHLYTFYWTGADVTSLKLMRNNSTNGGRLIQSVGAPYRGSGLAGDLASLGKVFDVGCGTNQDLTHEGADLWLTSIPKESRAQVYYYTTQYKDWSWCNLGSNMVLEWPNDGTTEYDYSQLEGGNNMGHTKGQCHTPGMKYPPQCEDEKRNAELNKNAAR